MDNETLQNLISRVESLESQSTKDSFSAEEIYRKYINIANRFKIPVVSTNPTIGSVGDIVCVVTTFKMCTVASTTAPTWTALLTTTGDGSGLTNVSLLKSLTAGENLALGDPVRFSRGTYNYINYSYINEDALIEGNYTGNGAVADSFVIPTGGGYVSTVVCNLKKLNSPTNNVIVTIEGPDSGNPTGTPLATATVACSSLTTSYAEYTFTFNYQIATAGTYWIVVTKTNYHATNVIYISKETSGASTAGRNYNGGWNNDSRHYMRVTLSDGTEGRVVKAKADTLYNSKVIGVATAAITSGNAGNILVNGELTGDSGLLTGESYYLQNAGGKGTTAGTVSKKIGIASSTTSLVLQLS